MTRQHADAALACTSDVRARPYEVIEVVPMPEATPDAASKDAVSEQMSVTRHTSSVRKFSGWRVRIRRDAKTPAADDPWSVPVAGTAGIAAQIGLLGPRWRVFTADVTHQYGRDVDALVIGPGGVFTVALLELPKAHVWVDGRSFVVDRERTPYIRNARVAARHTASLLSAATGSFVDVRAIICVGGAEGGFEVTHQPGHGQVYVVARAELATVLAGRSAQRDDSTLARLEEAITRPQTWGPVVEVRLAS